SACFTGKYQGITGIITFTEEDYGIRVDVDITGGLTDGPNPYHVHEYSIDYNGSCESAGGHLDPTGVGKVPGYVCNPKTPELCEYGDLSGKYGALPISPSGVADDEYIDPFITLDDPQSGVIGRSIVIHEFQSHPDVSPPRIACANIVSGECVDEYRRSRLWKLPKN
ncbi:6697_t:CDS:2, partial [Gigaspora margarita]